MKFCAKFILHHIDINYWTILTSLYHISIGGDPIYYGPYGMAYHSRGFSSLYNITVNPGFEYFPWSSLTKTIFFLEDLLWGLRKIPHMNHNHRGPITALPPNHSLSSSVNRHSWLVTSSSIYKKMREFVKMKIFEDFSEAKEQIFLSKSVFLSNSF